ncbi:hypothetical protein CC86DRAFT_88645 [Ophiobolus disseminans]|uniref:Uncharacterized protein n=1 Tax=Ophiobolus disseminans TaxID=1469910 RepID=A0A6A7AGB7_9PLEO|nr:hypothetical protein CC86DRAFT_88645 [Ophiobolus disseminans]
MSEVPKGTHLSQSLSFVLPLHLPLLLLLCYSLYINFQFLFVNFILSPCVSSFYFYVRSLTKSSCNSALIMNEPQRPTSELLSVMFSSGSRILHKSSIVDRNKKTPSLVQEMVLSPRLR